MLGGFVYELKQTNVCTGWLIWNKFCSYQKGRELQLQESFEKENNSSNHIFNVIEVSNKIIRNTIPLLLLWAGTLNFVQTDSKSDLYKPI